MSREPRNLNPDLKAAPGDGSSPAPDIDPGPFDSLPRLGLPQVRLERRLRNWGPEGRLDRTLGWLEQGIGTTIRIERSEILWRASGMGRPGLIVQLTVPRLGTRMALGIEVPLAHHVVDRLLGFDRPFAESRLQITPVEWGIWSFLVLRALESLDSGLMIKRDSQADPGLLGPGDMTLDRVGPDAFDTTGLGSIVTIRWAVRVGNVAGAVRLWLPESIVQLWLASPARTAVNERQSALVTQAPDQKAPGTTVSQGELTGAWRALAGFVSMPQGLRRLRTGGVLPLTETRLIGSPRNPSGPVDLILDLDEQESRFRIPTRPVADSGGRLLRLDAVMLRERRPRDAIFAAKLSRTPMSQSSASQNPAAPPAVAPLDVPVTLIVELGRHSRAPVELTSGGRLVARGELVQIDTDLGVRVTNVFL